MEANKGILESEIDTMPFAYVDVEKGNEIIKKSFTYFVYTDCTFSSKEREFKEPIQSDSCFSR